MEAAASFSLAQKLSRNHFRDSPAPWVTPITCQAPGTAQQKVCTRPWGSMDSWSVWANTTPEVPMVVKALPSRTTPVPTAAGVHIILYVADVPAGAAALEDVRDAVAEDVLADKRQTYYEEQVAQWIADANPQYYPERMQ